MWSITPLLLGALRGVPTSLLFGARTDCVAPGTIPVYSYLVRELQGDGCVLFDLGPPPPEVALSRGRSNVVAGMYRNIERALAEECVDPSQVQSVVLSHLHWDHIDGLDRFPGAAVYVQAEELRFAAAEDAIQSGFYRNAADHLAAANVVAVHGRHELSDGLEIIPLPGHTPGSQGLSVSTPDGVKVCCGDLVYRRESILELEDGTYVPPGICHDPKAWCASVRLVTSIGSALMAHDERVAQAHAQSMGAWRSHYREVMK